MRSLVDRWSPLTHTFNDSPASATAISPERSCASGDWNPAHRPHYASSPVTSLAAGATTRHFQVGDTGSQVLERPSTCLADDFRLAGRSRPSSRSAASMMLDIPRTTTSLRDRAFAVAGLRVWNSLSPAIRDLSLSLSIFGKLLKTYLFV